MDMIEIKRTLMMQKEKHCKEQNNITDVENTRIMNYDLMAMLQLLECEWD